MFVQVIFTVSPLACLAAPANRGNVSLAKLGIAALNCLELLMLRSTLLPGIFVLFKTFNAILKNIFYPNVMQDNVTLALFSLRSHQ